MGWNERARVDRSTRKYPVGRLLIGILVGAAVSGFSIWILMTAIDMTVTVELLRGADASLIAATLIPLALSMVIRTGRWGVLLRSANGGHTPRSARLLPIVLAGYAANAILPLRLGDVGRAVVGARRLRLGFPETIGTIGLERVLDAGALAAVALVASVGANVPAWLVQTSLVLVAAAVGFVGFVYVVNRIARRVPRPTPSMLSRLGRGLRSDPRSITLALVLSLIVWCVDGITFWIAARALGVEIGPEVAVLIATGAAAGGILPSAPAAIGTFELAGTAVGLALGLDSAAALGIVVLGHIVTLAPLLVAGAISVPIIGLGGRDLRAGSVLLSAPQAPGAAAEGG